MEANYCLKNANKKLKMECNWYKISNFGLNNSIYVLYCIVTLMLSDYVGGYIFLHKSLLSTWERMQKGIISESRDLYLNNKSMEKRGIDIECQQAIMTSS